MKTVLRWILFVPIAWLAATCVKKTFWILLNAYYGRIEEIGYDWLKDLLCNSILTIGEAAYYVIFIIVCVRIAPSYKDKVNICVTCLLSINPVAYIVLGIISRTIREIITIDILICHLVSALGILIGYYYEKCVLENEKE